jgi:hypothetical protein
LLAIIGETHEGKLMGTKRASFAHGGEALGRRGVVSGLSREAREKGSTTELVCRFPIRTRRRWVVGCALRGNIDDPSEYAYYLAYRLKETPVDELIQIASRRWQLEDSFEATKGEVGLDEFKVLKWEGWYRHITLCLSAHAKPARFDTVLQPYCNRASTG